MLFSISKHSFPRIQGQLMRMTGFISGVVTPKDKTKSNPLARLKIRIFSMGITKPCCQLHPAPSTSNQLISTSTQLHLCPCSWLQPPSRSLQHPQQYSIQIIARNWAISPNFGWKFQTWPFWHEIRSHGILGVLILSPDKNWVLGKFGSKKTKLFVLS